jgi:hypothetical protein
MFLCFARRSSPIGRVAGDFFELSRVLRPARIASGEAALMLDNIDHHAARISCSSR